MFSVDSLCLLHKLYFKQVRDNEGGENTTVVRELN